MIFQLKMHHKAFGGQAPPDGPNPIENSQRFPSLVAGFWGGVPEGEGERKGEQGWEGRDALLLQTDRRRCPLIFYILYLFILFFFV